MINNDRANLEPARQPPEAADVRRLCEKLWGHTESSSALIPVNRASELSLKEMFPPITAEDKRIPGGTEIGDSAVEGSVE